MLRIVAILALGIMTLSAATITVSPKNSRQTIEGFGTCLVSWGRDAATKYDDELADLYTKTMGFNFMRVNMAAWAYPKIENPKDITADKIDLDAGRNSRISVFLNFAKKMAERRDDIKIIGTVWSPVPWMKINNQLTAGKGNKQEGSIQGNSYQQKKNNAQSRNRVKPEYFPHFVQWMVAQAQQFKDEGVPFYALSPGNEVMFNQSFESCVWTAKDFATIIGMLGEALDDADMGETLLFGPETMTQHNWSIANPLYIKELRANKTAWKHFDVFATHGYVDGFKADMNAESSLAYWNLIKDHGKPYWMTEGGTGNHEWPAPINGIASGVHNALVAGNVSAFVPWQISGKADPHSLIVGKTLSKKSHAMRHFSAFIRPGSKRIEVGESSENLRVSAYLHEDEKRLVIVAINAGEANENLNVKLTGLKAKSFSAFRTSESEDLAEVDPVAIRSKTATATIPAQSIVTLLAEDVR